MSPSRRRGAGGFLTLVFVAVAYSSFLCCVQTHPEDIPFHTHRQGVGCTDPMESWVQNSRWGVVTSAGIPDFKGLQVAYFSHWCGLNTQEVYHED